MLRKTTIKLMRATRDTLNLLIDLAESRDKARKDQPAANHGGVTFGSVYGNVDAGPGFGSVHNQPNANTERD